MASILENLEEVRRRLREACARGGRPRDAAELLAVTKYASAEQAAELLRDPGVRHVGESRVQGAVEKRRAVEALVGGERLERLTWRLVGHLQRNKARQALEAYQALDSLDSLELADRLDRMLAERGAELPVLVQVNPAGRPGQNGVAPEGLGAFLAALRDRPRLKVRGLMAIAPEERPAERLRPVFRTLRRLRDEHFGPDGTLSMGMSGDFEVAAEEGATLVRIGSLLFEEKISTE